MNIRTTETTVTFQHPFFLWAFDGKQPAGTYRLVIDDEEIIGLSFLAFQRVATTLYTPALAAAGGKRQVFSIDPAELETACRADAWMSLTR
jgi:hypothetical protein